MYFEIFANLSLDLLLFLTPLTYLMYVNKKTFSKSIKYLGLHFNSFFKNVFFGILTVPAMFAVQVILAFVLSSFVSNDLELVAETIKSLSPLFLIYVLFVRVVTEEIFFRGFLAKKLEEATFKKTGIKWLGLLFASIIFAFAHITYGSFFEVMGAMALGFVLGYVYLKRNSLVVSVVAHMLYNAIVITVILL